MDLGLRQRAPHRRAPRPHHPPCPHPGDERRELQAQAEPITTPAPVRITPLDPVGPQAPPTRGPPPAARRARRPARGALPWTTGTSYRRDQWYIFYAAAMAHNPAAVDNVRRSLSDLSLGRVGWTWRQMVMRVRRKRSAVSFPNCSSMKRRFHPDASAIITLVTSLPSRDSTPCSSCDRLKKPTSGRLATSLQKAIHWALPFARRRSSCVCRFGPALSSSARVASWSPSMAADDHLLLSIRRGLIGNQRLQSGHVIAPEPVRAGGQPALPPPTASPDRPWRGSYRQAHPGSSPRSRSALKFDGSVMQA